MNVRAESNSMDINGIASQIPITVLDKALTDTAVQSDQLIENLLKLNVMEQIDQSQLEYMGTIIDMYV